jgi:quercetin dioxygenase-like cupin family protein
MNSVSLTSLASEQLNLARQAHSGRSSHTVHGGHALQLRQTVVALASGHELAEHDSPGEATLQVLQGHVRLSAGDETWEGKPGDYVTIPSRRHSLLSLHDSVVVLTVVKNVASA